MKVVHLDSVGLRRRYLITGMMSQHEDKKPIDTVYEPNKKDGDNGRPLTKNDNKN